MVFHLRKADSINILSSSTIKYYCDNPNYNYYKRMFYVHYDEDNPCADVYIGDNKKWVIGYAHDNDNRWDDTGIGTLTYKRKNPFIVSGNIIDINQHDLNSEPYLPNDYFIGRGQSYRIEPGFYYYAYRRKEAICGTCQKIRFSGLAYFLLSEPCEGYPDVIPVKEVGIELQGGQWVNYFISGEGGNKNYSQSFPCSVPNYSRWENSCVYYIDGGGGSSRMPLTNEQIKTVGRNILRYNDVSYNFLANNFEYGGVEFNDGSSLFSYSYCDRDPLVAHFLEGYVTHWTVEPYPDDIAPNWDMRRFDILFPSSGTSNYYLFIPFISEDEFNAAKSANYDWDNTDVKMYISNLDIPQYRETRL